MHCFALTLKVATQRLERLRILQGGQLAQEHRHGKRRLEGQVLQADFATAIRNHLHPSPCLEHILRSRIERWIACGSVRALPGIACRRARRRLDIVRKLCPPCVLWAVVRTWFNGWCTGRRFQKRTSSSCVLSCQCSGEDSIEHYLSCPVVREVASRKLRFTPGGLDLRNCMLLIDVPEDQEQTIAISATLLYGVYSATNHLRHERCRQSPQHGFDNIWLAVRRAGLQSKRLADILKRLWA